MADFTRQIQSKLKYITSKIRKETKHVMATGDHKKAAKYLEKGRQYYNKKKYDAAGKCFAHALTVDPRYALAHYMMGLVLFKQNDSQAAKRYWEQAIKIDPSSDTAAKADKSIKALNAKAQNIITTLENRQKY